MAEMGGAKAASLALRIVALALSVGAAVVMGSVVSYNSALVGILRDVGQPRLNVSTKLG
uniref:Uncharacterized protein n=1 Tax=Aegilops tauschii TaxID=37682 RepID=M8BWY7_AEGTA